MDLRCALTLLIALAAASQALADGNGDPTPRTTMDVNDDAKVRQIMSGRWHNFGVDQNTVTRTLNQGPGGLKGCVTNIGPALQNDTKSLSSGRYGPKASNATVVVTGSVINVCR